MKKFAVGAAVLAVMMIQAAVSFAQCSPNGEEEGFYPLFDGRTLTDWDGNPDLWSVQDGAITGISADSGNAKINYNNFLTYQKPVPGNFVLKFDYWLSRQGNSGVQYRSWMMDKSEGLYRVNGYQADFDGGATFSGIVYGEGLRGINAQRGTVAKVEGDHNPTEVARFASNEELKAVVKIEDWNSYEVIADGFLFIHKINGRVMSVLVDNDEEMRKADGVLAIQLHAGPAMKVQVKNIRIKEIK